ncbi:uncharacterized protein [Coffea arabica]|uniref:Uncharacterized protein n=1 Tax=Coffea arabica TaxID=13443 RepID=A0A6P6SH95_COFAR|nr:uncharacterized protein LOC113690946 [Coffea arabica]
MAVAINRLKSQVYRKLPSQPELNLKNVSTMTLRSGKKIQGSELVIPKDKNEDRIEEELEEEGIRNANPKVISDSIIKVGTNSPPFSSRLEKPQKQDKEKEILEMFRKVTINIPLLDTIKHVPKYPKCLKNLCVNKKKLRGDEYIMVGENVSTILQRKLPPKCGNPDMFTIPCKIEHFNIKNAMLDLGDSINVMSKSIYDSLNLEPLKETGIIIQLVDHTFAYPDGVVEDVLVQVDGLIFPADFYVFYMNDESAPNPSLIILGRPFLSIAQTKIDVSKGTLTMEFDGEIVYFNIFDTVKHPVNSHSVFVIHAINPSLQKFSEFVCRGKFKVAANKYHRMKVIHGVKMSRKLRKNVALNGYLDPERRLPITRNIELHPD